MNHKEIKRSIRSDFNEVDLDEVEVYVALNWVCVVVHEHQVDHTNWHQVAASFG